MKILFLFFVLAISQAIPHDEWEMFKKAHGKMYKTSEEEEHRKEIFQNNKQFIEDHNKKFEEGLVSFDLKMNHYGDLANHEFKEIMNKYNRAESPKLGSGVVEIYNRTADDELPESVDWRKKGAVTPVKDQGLCGSCWAFSSTGSLEGQHFLKTGNLASLSEQNLIDCSIHFGNHGCNGGLMTNAFKYIAANGGLDTEDSYPYEAQEGECRFKRSDVVAAVTGQVEIPQDDEDALKSAIAKIGPVSVAISAGQDSFRFYNSGVYQSIDCTWAQLDHGVLAVGYGSENGEDFWLVKNSWGTSWGEDGYIKMARNKGNMCGIASMAIYPIV